MAETLAALADDVGSTISNRKFLLSVYDRLHIESSLHVPLVFLFWIRVVDSISPYWNYQGSQETGRYIYDVVEVLLNYDLED
jgi:hypothetical protein